MIEQIAGAARLDRPARSIGVPMIGKRAESGSLDSARMATTQHGSTHRTTHRAASHARSSRSRQRG
jgi:hypothetical protein